MTPAARLAAAIEVFEAIEKERRPASDALKSWGLAHRFAGSGDRAAIAGLVYDALRRRASSAFLMGEDNPRAVLLGMLRRERGLSTDEIAKLADGSKYAPASLSETERVRLNAGSLDDASPHVAGDYPGWLDPHLAKTFGHDRAEEGAALASRAPLDLRVNALKVPREEAGKALADLLPGPTPWSPWGLRIRLSAEAKSPAIHAEPGFLKGLVELQDEGSQLAALFSGAKALALAAMMENKGQLFATDDDKRRLAPIHERLARSGARNVQVRTPKSVGTELDDLKGRMDLVLIDAPCTGTGAWRRNPDAKWRVRPGSLEQRRKEQVEVIERAVPLLKPGGRIAYVTCSVLDDENGAQMRGFIARRPEFAIIPPGQVAAPLGGQADEFLSKALVSAEGILMTPRRTDTDGFFVSVLRRH
jgi:16S rRNA (cytosine967-C5)-methyltransferase